jgi:16S rRNA (guanine527-N7)-methyltransferase
VTEDDARDWIEQRFGANSLGKLRSFAQMVVEESAKQNLIAASTIEQLWVRHMLDSAQLVPLAVAAASGPWLDVGTGAGFPGIVTAILSGRETRLIEPRRRRAAFLDHVIEALALRHQISVAPIKVEAEALTAAIISARAVSQIDALFESARHCASKETLWLLPKGKAAREEVASAQRSWHGVFHVERSVTDPESLIVIANKVSRR